MKNKKIYIGIIALFLLANLTTLSVMGINTNDDLEIILMNEYGDDNHLFTTYTKNDVISEIIVKRESLNYENDEFILNANVNEEIVLAIDDINNDIPGNAIPMADVYVDDDAEVGGDGSYEHPYQHIQDGINAAEWGYTVYVFSGTYVENVEIYYPITLKGENRETTIIDCDFVTDTVYISASNVIFSGFKVINSVEDDFHAGINVWHSSDINISNCILINNDAGIRLQYSDRCYISNCVIRNNYGPTVYIISSSNININNCYTKDNEDWWGLYAVACGICIKTSTNKISENIRIANCTIDADLGPGIFLFDGLINNVTIQHNIISNIKGAGGIVVTGIMGKQFSNILIYNNEIKNCETKSGWPAGIYIANCIEGITIQHNNILSNKKGVYLFWSSGIRVIENNFIDNEKSAGFSYLEGQSNTWNRNYWDEQIIHGNPKIILGYLCINYKRIRWLDFDWNPAKKPYNIIV